MIFFSLIAPKVRHGQTIDTKYTHDRILFSNERFCTLFAWKEQTVYAIQFLNKSSCLGSFQIAQLSAVKCLKKYISYMVMHVPENNMLTIQRLNRKRLKEFSLCKIHFLAFELRKQYKRGQVCSENFKTTVCCGIFHSRSRPNRLLRLSALHFPNFDPLFSISNISTALKQWIGNFTSWQRNIILILQLDLSPPSPTPPPPQKERKCITTTSHIVYITFILAQDHPFIYFSSGLHIQVTSCHL